MNERIGKTSQVGRAMNIDLKYLINNFITTVGAGPRACP
jgi:hypothetical protein